MPIILIRRCVKIDKEDQFLEQYIREKPKHPDFVEETLTKIGDGTKLPVYMKNFDVGSADCITYINVAVWKNVQSFIDTFPFTQAFDAEFETEERVRVVLDEAKLTS
jgi:hypothetical protein